MKKLFRTAALVVVASSFVAASAAQAKTEGSSVGVNLSYTRAKEEGSNRDGAYGYGLDYKYAVALGNNVYVAPGVFAEKLNNEASVNGNKAELSYRYGAKADLGYDVTKEVATYVTGGIARVKSKTEVDSEKSSERDYSAIYGLGVNYKICKNLAANLEYNRQKVKDSEVNTKINQIRVGVAYNF